MANIAAVLKDTIRRLARREIKAQVGSTRQAVARHRQDIAGLKRLIQEQEKKIARLQSAEPGRGEQPQAEEDPLAGVRFSARSVRSQRKRLHLSAEQYGRLIGVSGLTVYKWEHGKARPRKAQLAALVTVRNIGRREALARLEGLAAEAAAKGARGKRRAKK